MFVLFFFSTLSTYKQCYQKIEVWHHLRFTVKHNTAPAPPTFPWCAPSHPWFATSTRAFFFCPARHLKGTVTELFPLPAAHAAARTVCGWMRTTCTKECLPAGRALPCRRQGRVATGLHDQQKKRGQICCMFVGWRSAAREGGDRGKQIHGLCKIIWPLQCVFFFFFKARRTTTAAHRITRQHVYFAELKN